MINALLYPWDIQKLILSKNEYLNKKIKKNLSLKILIIGGYTVNELNDWIKIFCKFHYIHLDLSNLEWGSSLDLNITTNKLKQFDIIIVLTNYYDLIDKIDFKSKKIDSIVLDNLFHIWKISKINSINILQTLFENSPNNLIEDDKEFINANIKNFNDNIINMSKDYNNVSIINTNYISNFIGLNQYYNLRNWHSFGNYKSSLGNIYIAHKIAKSISNKFGYAKKLIILDLDNTLWGGVIGDIGVKKISLGPETNDGRVYYEFQKFLLKLKNNGIILSISSKNDYANVIEVFDHPYMLLKKTDFASIKVNWKNKHINAIEICKELNINPNASVFIDDNNIERLEMSEYLPMISVPNIGNDPTKFIECININNFFDTSVNLTNEDLIRNKSYLDNQKRKNFNTKFKDQKGFLKSLKTKVYINKINQYTFDRSVQLINKTNQFNLNTIRLTDASFKKILKIKNNFGYTISVNDKFGEYGIISIIYGVYKNKNILEITNWVLSCRIFNRKIEETIFQFIIQLTKKKKIKIIQSTLTKSNKNQYISDLHINLGFKLIKTKGKKSFWEFDVNKNKLEYDNINKLINE